MKKRTETLFILLVVGAILALLLACSSEKEVTKEVQKTENPGKADQKTEGPVIEVAADELFKAYQANEVAADEKYKGKVLVVSGIIENIGKDIMDTPYVSLKAGGEYSFGGVQCMFADEAKGQLANLQKDQNVKIKGKCEGKLMNVILRGSILQ